jgi:hypothetical protein
MKKTWCKHIIWEQYETWIGIHWWFWNKGSGSVWDEYMYCPICGLLNPDRLGNNSMPGKDR